jgi:tripartite-type tricarboxylate transporter receptor subunit TctC
MITGSNAINATLSDKLNFNFIRDIAPVASLTRDPHVLEVNPSLPVKSVPEFIAYAKANPNKINMAWSGIGSAAHVAGELFKAMTGVAITPELNESVCNAVLIDDSRPFASEAASHSTQSANAASQ